MEVRVKHGKGKQSEAFARFHRVVCDQSFDEGGMDTGMTPPELMLSSLGCCAMHYAVEYLRARGLPLDKIEIMVSAEKGDRPARLTDIGIELDVPGLTGHFREGLLKTVESCLLHRTLLNPPRMNIRMATPLAEAPARVVQPTGLAS